MKRSTILGRLLNSSSSASTLPIATEIAGAVRWQHCSRVLRQKRIRLRRTFRCSRALDVESTPPIATKIEGGAGGRLSAAGFDFGQFHYSRSVIHSLRSKSTARAEDDLSRAFRFWRPLSFCLFSFWTSRKKIGSQQKKLDYYVLIPSLTLPSTQISSSSPR